MRTKSLLAILSLGLAVSACGGTPNAGLESVHQPVVQRTNYVYDVPAGYDGVDVASQRRLVDWFDALKVGYGDTITVDDPSGAGRARQDVAGVAARYGLLVGDNAPLTEGAVAPGSVRVVVSRTIAHVPGCPDWSRASQPEFGANSMSNYGCATNASLAAMVARPEDLVQGQVARPGGDPVTSGNAIRKIKPNN